MIDLRGVSKAYRGVPALRDLSLRVPAGSVFGLLGPNGAGKTTLLRLVMGMLRPDAGALSLFEGLAPGAREAVRRIGYMPQQLALYEGLSVGENVAFFGRLYGLGGGTLRRRVDEVIGRVRLEHRRDSLAGTLSGGMMRRAMLASALVHEPRLLILDEPTAGVDPLLRIQFWDWFDQLACEGVTLLITTHHIAEAARCREVLFLREGRLLEQGRPEALIARYGAADLEAAFVEATRERLPAGLDGGEGRP
jgi:ABC-2 type transport system ATP-binding protein